jgi:hypothetical protein
MCLPAVCSAACGGTGTCAAIGSTRVGAVWQLQPNKAGLMAPKTDHHPLAAPSQRRANTRRNQALQGMTQAFIQAEIVKTEKCLKQAEKQLHDSQLCRGVYQARKLKDAMKAGQV